MNMTNFTDGREGIPFPYAVPNRVPNVNHNFTNMTNVPTYRYGGICREAVVVHVAIALNIILVLLGGFNNCLVALVVTKTKLMQNPTNLLLSNNALTEVIFLVASGLNLVIHLTYSDIELYGKATAVISTIDTTSYSVGVINLALLANERFNALCNPMKIQRRLGKRSTKFSIVIMWLMAIILVFPLTVSSLRNDGFLDFPHFIYYCSLIGILATTAGFTIIYCYGRIIYGIYISKTIFNPTCSVTISEDIKAKKKIVKMLVSITLTFWMTKFPLAFFIATAFVQRKVNVHCLVDYEFFLTLAHVSAFLNPLIYLKFSANYRQQARRLLNCCFHNIG